jgi:hypothetical protein
LPRYGFPIALAIGKTMSWSFYNADRRAHRKIVLVGLLLCTAFVAVCFFARPQADSGYVLVKADKLVRTAAKSPPAN